MAPLRPAAAPGGWHGWRAPLLAGHGSVPGMVGQKSMTTRIGFVRPPGPMGDGIRYAAVLDYLQRRAGNVVDIPLLADPNDECGSDRWRALLASRPWRWGPGAP